MPRCVSVSTFTALSARPRDGAHGFFYQTFKLRATSIKNTSPMSSSAAVKA